VTLQYSLQEHVVVDLKTQRLTIFSSSHFLAILHMIWVKKVNYLSSEWFNICSGIIPWC